jgi:hypothetical protein
VFLHMVRLPFLIRPTPPENCVPDLYGRGYSDAPDVPYNTSLYTTQLALLMQHVGWSSACVAGVSMVSPRPTSAFNSSFTNAFCEGWWYRCRIHRLIPTSRLFRRSSLSGWAAPELRSTLPSSCPGQRLPIRRHARALIVPDACAGKQDGRGRSCAAQVSARLHPCDRVELPGRARPRARAQVRAARPAGTSEEGPRARCLGNLPTCNCLMNMLTRLLGDGGQLHPVPILRQSTGTHPGRTVH